MLIALETRCYIICLHIITETGIRMDNDEPKNCNDEWHRWLIYRLYIFYIISMYYCKMDVKNLLKCECENENT